jgi:ABC-type sugar transport system ATPase subunit
MASIRVHTLTKRFASGSHALRGIDLAIEDGEFVALVGPSGCGKSTLLRMLAGLETPDTGRIEIAGRDITDLPPQARDLAMVFQSYALYPHMTVRDNLAYGLRVRGTNPAAIAERVTEAAASLGLDGLLDRRPAQLSGGQRQRVALGRAIVRTPQAFLLDEPLSNLDPGLRMQAREELRRLHARLRATVVYVTHDQEEAMTLGGRIAVMRDGAIEQIGAPLDVYHNPVNMFVATFIGTPAMNIVPAAGLGIAAPPGTSAGIRPHDVVLGSDGPLRGRIEFVEPRGHDALVRVHLEDARVSIVAVANASAYTAGSIVGITVPQDRVHLFGEDNARLGNEERRTKNEERRTKN